MSYLLLNDLEAAADRRPDQPRVPVRRERRFDTPVCCGVPGEPELAQARDHEGRSLYVTVWRCPRCGGAQRDARD